MSRLAAVFVLSLLLGCQGPAPVGPASPYYTIPEGSTLALERPLTIPAGHASVYLEGGRIRAQSALERYYPYCKFELWTVSERSHTVEPERFRVKAVRHRSTQVMGPPTRPLQVAALGAMAMDDDGAYVEIMETQLYLEAERQGDVYRMSCAHWDDIDDARHLTVAEIRAALGDWFTLTLAP